MRRRIWVNLYRGSSRVRKAAQEHRLQERESTKNKQKVLSKTVKKRKRVRGVNYHLCAHFLFVFHGFVDQKWKENDHVFEVNKGICPGERRPELKTDRHCQENQFVL